ncbi:MAG: ABC transporter substrate-binding protein [Cypionkella sp.]
MLKPMKLAALLLLGTSVAAFAEEPRQGGKLIFTAPYGSSFSTMDIQSTPQTQDEIAAIAIQRSLYKWNSTTNTPELDLASSVDVSEDGLTWTYHLKDGVTFHNGSAFTADDIIWSYERIINPKNAFPGARYFADVEGVEDFKSGAAEHVSGLKKVDDLTFQIVFTAPIDPSFDLLTRQASIYPSDLPADHNFGTDPVGLGPFKLGKHIPGSMVQAVKYDGYYEKGKPYLDEVDVVIMEDASARDVAFRNKEIDTSVLGGTQYQTYQSDPDLAKGILEVAEMFTRNVAFSPKFAPFADKRVRQAMNYAINADLIIEKLVKGKAYRAVSWLPTTSPAFDTAMKPYPYDPEKAKALLAEAGFADGFEFELTATQNESWGIPIVEAMIPMLAQVGVKLVAKPVESSVLSEVIPAGDFQAAMWSNNSGPDALSTLRCFYSKTAQSACNYAAYNSPEFDKLFDAATAERDPAKRTDLLRQANNELQDGAPVWFFNYNKAVMAYQPWVHGLQANATELAIQDYGDIWIDDTAPDSRK